MQPEAFYALTLGLVAILSIFVVLPWLFLHYFAKARSAGSLSDDETRMLEDLWRSARTMERRIETLERLLETEGGAARGHASSREKGDRL